MLKLTDGQAMALSNIKDWLNSGELFYRLKGYAGTGKTTMTQEVIKLINIPNIAITAPTHQATIVISDKTGIEGRTIQSLLGLAPNTNLEEFDSNNPQFAVINREIIEDFNFLIVDEASMLSTDLLLLIEDAAQKFRVRVLFVYDDAQLPPVGDIDIPINDVTHMGISQLTEVVRQAEDSPLLDILTKIRGDLNTLKYPHYPSKKGTDGGLMNMPEEKFIELIQDRFVKLFKNGKTHTERVLAFTNKSVSAWNSAIRKSIREAIPEEKNNPFSAYFMVGEVLTSYTTLRDSMIRNSGNYVVEMVEPKRISLSYKEIDSNANPKSDWIPIIIKVFRLRLRDVTTGKRELVDVLANSVKNFSKYYKVHTYYHTLGVKKRLWPKYYGWREKIMLMKDLMVDGRLITRKDLDYSYASTVHKSQGSTYRNVYIDIPDILKLEDAHFCRFLYNTEKKKARKNMMTSALFSKRYPSYRDYFISQQNLKNRLLYVALSRPEVFAVLSEV